MQRKFRHGLVAVVLCAGLTSINAPATQAMVIPVTTASAIAGSAPAEPVRWHGYGYGWRWGGGWGWGGGGALAASLVVDGLYGCVGAA